MTGRYLKEETFRLLHVYWLIRRAGLLRSIGCSYADAGAAINRHPDTIRCYERRLKQRGQDDSTRLVYYLPARFRTLLRDQLQPGDEQQERPVLARIYDVDACKGFGKKSINDILNAIDEWKFAQGR